MASRKSRKRGHRSRPAAAPNRPPSPAGRTSKAAESPAATRPTRASRTAARDATIRAALKPYAPGERPWSIKLGALTAFLIGGLQLLLYVLGVKLSVSGTQAKAGSTIVFGALMFACAGGMWLMRYWAVLGFMALMAIFSLYFGLALIKASSLLGLGIAVLGLAICGTLFYKLVRVLSRIQMPRYPGRT